MFNGTFDSISQVHIVSGFLIKRQAIVVIPVMPTTIHIGVTPCISATKGAKMVAVLAKTLHIPSEVAVNSVGNNAELPI